MSLKKDLKFIDVFSIATGAMISSGIFILPGLAFAKAGPAVFVSYFLAGLLALTGAFSVAELASAMPKAGGDYYFITRSLGPLFGSVSGLLSWFALSLKTAFAIIGIAEILHVFFGMPLIVSSIILTVIFVAINILGVKEAGAFESIIVIFLLIIMVMHIIIGMPHVNVFRFEDFTPKGANSVILTAGFVFVAYGGLLKIASLSEEVKNPSKNIPLGMFTSLFVVTILYSLITFVVVGTVNPEQLSSSLTPIADSAEAFMGNFGKILLTIGALLAFVSTGNAGIMAASRYPFALSRDKLLPGFISHVHGRANTPVISILITGVIISLSYTLQLDILVKAASVVVMLTYILAQISIIILRVSGIANYKPSFRAPLFPFMQIISIALFVLLIIDMGKTVILISAGLVVLGVLFYLIYGRSRNTSEFALLALLERLTNKKLVSVNLNKELKEIITERERIVFDRFDTLVNDADIVDIQEKQTLEQVFVTIADVLDSRLDLTKEQVIKLLMDRENDTSTAITPFVAIPHIVIEGRNKFELLILRCKEGVYFSDNLNAVKCMFVLVGTMDERNFHLQALSAIAQIVLDKNFERGWMKARNIHELRDLIHLSERRRFHM